MRIIKKLSAVFILLVGSICGVSIELNKLANSSVESLNNFTLIKKIFFGAILFSTLLWLIRKILHRIVHKSKLSSALKTNYYRYDIFTYGIFLLPSFGAIGIQFTFQLVILMILTFLVAQFLLIYFFINSEDRQKILLSPYWLSFLFLFSGFAALVYQILWQRILFTVFGVNIESITVVVSVFMFGLGVGSMVGGWLSKKYSSFLPHLFLICEILIGLFGLISIPLIKGISSIVSSNSLLSLSLTTYAILCIPTTLMGATLPILVTYLHGYLKNIGISVGTLYSLNTIGSAIACFVTVEISFILFGQQTTVIIAALFNFSVGILVYIYTKKLQKQKNSFIKATHHEQYSYQNIKNNKFKPAKKDFIRFFIALILSTIVGYISLSQEMLWIRTISYATGGKPDVFAYVIGFFLLGIALGSMFAIKICEKNKILPITYIAIMLFISSVFFYFSLPLNSHLLIISEQNFIMLYFSVMIVSFLTGGIFPVLCHFGIRSINSVGISLSWIYFANIVGSTAGPLVTGFILLNIFNLDQIIYLLSIASLIFVGIVFFGTNHSIKTKIFYFSSVIISILIIAFLHDNVYSQILEKLHYKNDFVNKKPYKYLLQNRVGIIAVEESITDIIYGGGVYDGRFNIDPILNTNGIRRAYMIAALHPNPKDILEIGLSSGSWTWVLASHKNVEKIDVVEINPGYLDVIKNYSEHATVLKNPKINIHIDDGRRWLNRNPDSMFDIIVMNTTFHWRSHATNLLSEEFLNICKKHLKPGGVIYYNTTWSDDVVFTASKVFKHVVRYDNFIAASDSPFSMSYEEKINNLLGFQKDGEPLFDKGLEMKKILHDLASSDLSDIAEEIRNKKGLLKITDDNMATEFKRINNMNRWQIYYDPKKTWLKLLSKIKFIS